MKVKDIYKKYKDYHIYVYGRPLENRKYMTPFSYIPLNANLDELEVLDFIVEDKEIEIQNFSMNLKYKGKEKYKGRVYVYAK